MMEIKDFIKEFPNSILINSNTKTVWITKNGKLKVYSQKYYYDFVNSVDLTKIPI